MFLWVAQAFVCCGTSTQTLLPQQCHQALVRIAFFPTDKKKKPPIQKQLSQQRKIEKMPRQQHRDILIQKRKCFLPLELFIQNFLMSLGDIG